MVRNLRKEIETGAKDLAERIREYSRSQVELWQQVMAVAPEVKRKASFAIGSARKNYALKIGNCDRIYDEVCQNFSSANYNDGYWQINPKRMRVELKTGNLFLESLPMSDISVLELTGSFYQRLDAGLVLSTLNTESKNLDHLIDKINGNNIYYRG